MYHPAPARATRMTDLREAKQLFQEAGLAFPAIPEELAARMEKREKWVFATRALDVTPYKLDHYLLELLRGHSGDYAVLAHSGHGINSYAIQYYLVHGALRLFLHLAWGGVYTDEGAASANVRDCFALADEIVPAVRAAGLASGDVLVLTGTDFYGSCWWPPAQKMDLDRAKGREFKQPAEMLADALAWLRESGQT